jgi:hypothetical protein
VANIENLIAFKGKVLLDKAIWDNIWGMYVTFDLEQRYHEVTVANPFKKFTRMKKGKVGTRFAAVLSDASGDTIIYDDEVMLKGWSDGTTGWKVTFWLAGDNRHPFIRFDKGHEFMLAAIELDDDQEAIDQVKRQRLETPRKKPGLSNYAAMLCRTPEFHEYMESNYKVQVFGLDNADHIAKRWMCEELDIESRAELDSNPHKGAAFHAGIREPYSKWYNKRY